MSAIAGSPSCLLGDSPPASPGPEPAVLFFFLSVGVAWNHLPGREACPSMSGPGEGRAMTRLAGL